MDQRIAWSSVVLLVASGCGGEPARRDASTPRTDGHVVVVDTSTGGASDTGLPSPTTDTDGDTISDLDETNIDSDRDGTPNSMDLDSDGDGLLDAAEAGDAILSTPPIDTDGDETPDFLDLDSDDDGVSDADERMGMTNPLAADTDMDGVSDLVERAAMTNPTDRDSNPRAEGNFFFFEPYRQPPSPSRDTLVFATNIQKLDVFFMVDSSISMQGRIDRLRTGLISRVIPGVRGAVPDVQFGAGEFDICPQQTAYMSAACRGIAVGAGSTADGMAVETALRNITADCSGVNEPYAQAVWLWAGGPRASQPMWQRVTAASCTTGIGVGCLRSDALPVLVMVGDEPFAESYRQAGGCSGQCTSCAMFPMVSDIVTAMNAIGGRVVVLGPTASGASGTTWTQIAMGTNSVGTGGAPLLFPDAGDSNVDAQVVEAIEQLVANTPLDISTRARDVDADGVDATRFIARIETNTTGGVADPRDATRICVGGLATLDTNSDGVPDTFDNVRPGVPVCFDIVPAQNEFVPPTSMPQLFRAEIDVVADGVTVLDTRSVYFLVPPGRLMLPCPGGCPGGEFCVNGQCVTDCPMGQSECATVCCATGDQCFEGVCAAGS